MILWNSQFDTQVTVYLHGGHSFSGRLEKENGSHRTVVINQGAEKVRVSLGDIVAIKDKA